MNVIAVKKEFLIIGIILRIMTLFTKKPMPLFFPRNMLKPQMAFTAITSITGAFEVGNISASLFGNPSTNYAAHTVALHMLDYSEQRLDYGMACVMAVILFVLMVGTNSLFKKFINRIGR